MGIHERLGVLCETIAPQSDKGPNFTLLDNDYLSDLWAMEYEKTP